jgi:hypothetical protein
MKGSDLQRVPGSITPRDLAIKKRSLAGCADEKFQPYFEGALEPERPLLVPPLTTWALVTGIAADVMQSQSVYRHHCRPRGLRSRDFEAQEGKVA